MEKLLKELYYDVSSPACYSGVLTLLREAKKRDVNVRRKTGGSFSPVRRPTPCINRCGRISAVIR